MWYENGIARGCITTKIGVLGVYHSWTTPLETWIILAKNAGCLLFILFTEEAEEQIAINHRQELTGDLLPTVVQFENLENQIYQCAPGENNIPKYILLDNDFEVLAFPDLFPYGSSGYHSVNRKINYQ